MELLIELRADARTKKDFATGDKIRNSLTEMGITLEDRKGGAPSGGSGAAREAIVPKRRRGSSASIRG